MSGAHIHLIFNAVPIYGSILAALFFVLALAGRHRDAWTRAGLLTLALSVGGGIVTFLSGMPAEHAVNSLPNTSGKALSEHHVRGIVGASLLVIAGIAGVVAAIRARKLPSYSTQQVLGVLIATVAAAGALSWTGMAGGRISHPELQSPADREAGPAHPH